ncbi:MAG: DinB family protein [Chloroflexi bacterium]|nr:DinB family protein [Chloroflexota bacterium]
MHTCDEAWTALDRSFKEFMDCLGQLTEDELTSAPVAGKWTVKDVVIHVWSWLDEAIHTAQAWHGPRPWQKGVTYNDAWNEKQVDDRAALPLITVVDGITSAHRRLMHVLDSADAETLATVGRAPWGEEMPLVEFFYGMAGHYTEHVANLKTYQERCLNGC